MAGPESSEATRGYARLISVPTCEIALTACIGPLRCKTYCSRNSGVSQILQCAFSISPAAA